MRRPLRGVVYSATEVHRAPSPAFASAVPYVVVLVRAEAGGLVMGRARGLVAPAIGTLVLVVRAVRRSMFFLFREVIHAAHA